MTEKAIEITKKQEISSFIDNLSSKDFKNISQFVSKEVKQNIRPFTSPSPVLTGDVQEIGLTKLDPRDIEKFLWMHPVVPRGVEIKANSMIKRGYSVDQNGTSANAKASVGEMNELIENSGGLITIKKWIEDGYGFGNGFRTLALNKAGTKVLRFNAEHPIYFRVRRFSSKHEDKLKRNKMMIDPRTKEPAAYNQVTWDNTYQEWVQLKLIKAERVAHLKFDTWGDEAVGISLVQYLHLTLKYLMNIEEAAAETLFRNGFVQKKVTTDINNEKDLKKLAKSLALINRKDAIILPRGTDVENLNPGTSDFPDFHPIFIKLLASRLGVPIPFLMQDGTQTNKATIQEMSKLMYEDFRADELVVQKTIEDQIFSPACRLLYGKDFKDIPKFRFNSVPEDKELRTEIFLKESMAMLNITNAVAKLLDVGKTKEADKILERLGTFFEERKEVIKTVKGED